MSSQQTISERIVSETEYAKSVISVTQPRLWPLVVSLLTQFVLFALSITPSINNAMRFGFMLIGPAIGALLLVVWLLGLSRLPWKQRLAAAAMIAACVAVAAMTVHKSVGLSLFLYGVPLTTLAVLAAIVTTKARPQIRLRTLAACVVPVWAIFPFVRVDGYDGQYLPELSFRGSLTAEERMLAEQSVRSTAPEGIWQPVEEEWPEFRGSQRDGRASFDSGVQYWDASAPTEFWRHPIGPGWSSFIYVSGRLFTQEQRGDVEAVTCYDATTGVLIWLHSDEQRFSDVVSGSGSRATPTYASGRIYAYGSKGILNCLDAATGSVVWQRDLMTEVNAKLPVWGFASSPLVANDLVIVYADGDDNNGLVAYNSDTGEPAWRVTSGGMNFSSAQLVTIDNTPQIIFGDSNGLRAFAPSTGEEIWSFKPTEWRGPNVCQPQMVSSTDFVVPTGDGTGVVRVSVTRDQSGVWQVSERWSNNRIKPSFNDFVFYGGHLYGFDQSILVCLDAETGERRWKGGRYGFGQMLLLESIGQIIVISETGELVLINAAPERLDERARIPAIEGKTWNHPIVVGDRLFIRNGEEMAAFELGSGNDQ